MSAAPLLPADIRVALPELYANDGKGLDAVAVVKFFYPRGAATWYVTEFDGDDLMFGLADMGFGFPELGYISLGELTEFRDRHGLGIERDLYWKPRPLSECLVWGSQGRQVPAAIAVAQ
ncbi:MAG: DUF2958 domain-containing protein [Dehalococcoidia bacterium]